MRMDEARRKEKEMKGKHTKSLSERSGKRKFSRRKYETLICYIAAKVPEPTPQKIRLLLYLIDYDAYAVLGRSITGEIYTKSDDGIMPVHFEESLSRLLKSKKIILETIQVLRVKQTRKATDR